MTWIESVARRLKVARVLAACWKLGAIPLDAFADARVPLG